MGLGLAIFILPIGFIRDPALLWQGHPFQIVMAGVGIVCATSAWAIALQGWLKGPLRWGARILFACSCFVVVYEPTFSLGWSIGFIAFILLYAGCCVESTKPFLQRVKKQEVAA